MTDEEIEAAAEADEENPPWTDEELERGWWGRKVRLLRKSLMLTQEAFAERYMIPVKTLRAWEQGATTPDAAGKAYIRAIAGDSEGVARALQSERRRAAE
jgi:putative transcriptional regulator